MYESLHRLDGLTVQFDQPGILNIILALIMFGVALGISGRQFVQLIRHPKPVFAGVFLQFLVLPFITFLLVVLLRNWITPTVAMGMILVAACPGGNISNFMTSLSKGNTELSVTLSVFSTGFAVFMTPLNFSIWGSMYMNFVNRHVTDTDMLQTLTIDYWLMFKIVFLILGIPIILGMLCTKYLPKIAEKMKKPLQVFSIIFFVALVVIMFTGNWNLFVNYIHWVFIIVLVHNFLALFSGFSISKWVFKQPQKNIRTLTIETGIQNSGLGLVLLFNPNIFPPELAIGGMLFIAAWWGIWHIVSGLGLSWFWSKRPPKEA